MIVTFVSYGQNLIRGGIKLYIDISRKLREKYSEIDKINIINIGKCGYSAANIREALHISRLESDKISIRCLNAASDRFSKYDVVFGFNELIDNKSSRTFLFNLINRVKISDRLRVIDKYIKTTDIVHVSPWYLSYVPYIIDRSIRYGVRSYLFPFYHPFLFDAKFVKLSYYLNYFKLNLLGSYMFKVDGITVSTPFELKVFSPFNKRVYHVGEGVDLEFIRNINLDSNSNKLKSINRLNGLKVVYIGARSKGKRYDFLLRSIIDLYTKRKVKVHLLVAGPGPNPVNGERDIFVLENLLRRKGVLKDFGIISEKEKFELINKSDIAVMPSLYETIPLFFLESWAMSKPVIGPNIPSISSLIEQQGDGGFLYNFMDWRSLSNLIYYIYENRIDLEKVGKKGYLKVKLFYNLDKVSERLIKIYKGV